MRRGIDIMHDGAIQVYTNAFEVCIDVLHEAGEDTRSCCMTLRHPKPLVQTSWRNNYKRFDRIWVNRFLEGHRYEVTRGKYAAASQITESFINARKRLVANVIPTSISTSIMSGVMASRLFRRWHVNSMGIDFVGWENTSHATRNTYPIYTEKQRWRHADTRSCFGQKHKTTCQPARPRLDSAIFPTWAFTGLAGQIINT